MKKLYTEEIDQILSSVEGIEQASPSAFFYNKLMHKIHQTTQQKKPSFIFQFKPILVITSLSLLVIMNAFLLVKQSSKSNKTIASSAVSSNSSYDFSEDYQLNTTTNY